MLSEMSGYDFVLAFLRKCCLRELEELKEVICQEIVKRQKATVSFKIVIDRTNPDCPKEYVKEELKYRKPQIHEPDCIVKVENVSPTEEGSRNAEKDPLQIEHENEPDIKIEVGETELTSQEIEKNEARTNENEKLKEMCQFCGKRFISKSKKERHERIHTGEKPFKCNFCQKTFVERQQKIAHERVHTGEKPYQCQFCEMKFSWSGQKISHELVHTGEQKKIVKEKPFKCQICEKTFSYQCQKTLHERIHTGEKPFKCNFCDKKFTSKGGKTAHEIKKHSIVKSEKGMVNS